MGLGILETSITENAPGTVLLNHNDFSQLATISSTRGNGYRKHSGKGRQLIRRIFKGENEEAESATENGSKISENFNPALKYDISGSHPIVLEPQPSDDPDDPLNWPLWQRDLILVILAFQSVIATTLSPILAAITLDLTVILRRSLHKTALLTGWHLLAVGITGFFVVPAARVYGKRPCYLFGSIIMAISCLWGGIAAQQASYRSTLGARILQGVALAPFEALVNASVGDLFYVHERGKRMAISNMALFGSAFLTPVIVGRMTDDVGWQWSFYILAILAIILFPLIYYFVPETAYRRGNDDINENNKLSIITNSPSLSVKGTIQNQFDGVNSSLSSTEEVRPSKNIRSPSDATIAVNVAAAPAHVQGKLSPLEHHSPPNAAVQHYATRNLKSFFQKRRLAVFTGRKTSQPLWKLLIRPIPLFFHPGVTWACLIQGTLIGWMVFLGVVLASLMFAAHGFDKVRTGYMYVSATVGALGGFALSGALADRFPAYLSKRNHGVFEPEFRLVLIIPQLILATIGLLGFGITASTPVKYGWFWPAAFFACQAAATVLGAVAASLYVVDAHREIAIESLTCLLVFKNLFSFALSFYAPEWLGKTGTRRLFTIITFVQLAIALSTIPMYIFGKVNRAYFRNRLIIR